MVLVLVVTARAAWPSVPVSHPVSVFCPAHPTAGVRGDLPLHRGAAVHGPEGPGRLLQRPATARLRGDRWAPLVSRIPRGSGGDRSPVNWSCSVEVENCDW